MCDGILATPGCVAALWSLYATEVRPPPSGSPAARELPPLRILFANRLRGDRLTRASGATPE